jgi:hypothetical protein
MARKSQAFIGKEDGAVGVSTVEFPSQIDDTAPFYCGICVAERIYFM